MTYKFEIGQKVTSYLESDTPREVSYRYVNINGQNVYIVKDETNGWEGIKPENQLIAYAPEFPVGTVLLVDGVLLYVKQFDTGNHKHDWIFVKLRWASPSSRTAPSARNEEEFRQELADGTAVILHKPESTEDI